MAETINIHSDENSSKSKELPSIEEQVNACVKAGKEGKIIEWDGTNL